MKTSTSVNGHPVHPILVTFPIAFFSGTLFFDVLSIFRDDPGMQTIAATLQVMAMITAVVAAIPGLADYVLSVPPKSSAKKRGGLHATLNFVNILLFLAAWLLKRDGRDLALPLVLEAAGFLMMCFAGWMGGTLVYRNQIGVDIRYANAGKTREERFNKLGSGDYKVASADELEENQMKLIHVEGKRIVIGKNNEGYVAFDDRCPHKGGSLAGGAMICGTVQCPWHGSQFETKTGKLKAGPAKVGIATYQLTEKEGAVYLHL